MKGRIVICNYCGTPADFVDSSVVYHGHSFGITDHLNGGSVFVLLLIGGEYRDRTGDLLHAMQALSRTTHSRTPTQRCGDDRYSSL